MPEINGTAALTAEPSAGSAPPVAGAVGGAPAPAEVPNGAAGAAPGAPVPGSQGEKWWQTFGDETLRGYAETKNFPSAEEAVRSYQNLEKIMGAKANAVMIPGEDASDEERAAFYEKIGRPGAPDNYPVPDALKEDAIVKGFAGEAHKLGMTSKQFEGVMSFVAAQQQADESAMRAKKDAASAADMDSLKKDMPGLKYDQLIEHGRRAMRSLGMDTPMLNKLEDAFGTRGMLEFMGKIGAGSAEAPFIDGQHTTSGVASPEAAKLEIASLSKDQAFMKKWTSGDVEAIARMNKLNAAIAAGAKR